MTWRWLALVFGAPLLAGFVAAVLIRIVADATIANAIGAFVVVMVMLLLFASEFIALDRMHAACRAVGQYCPTFPGDFRRYSVIGLLGFGDVGVLYMVTLVVDEWRRRRKGYSA